ncbi:hypothetical protein Tco_0840974 [Tanacetum coccineum]|uniref:Uncharacterized protein n=1 Tax=Tanacetum coccineum TaxID=301880 RepID=A0ABQ5AXD3_9ASTR
MECRVESLMRNEVLLEYDEGFTFPKRPYWEELEGRILKLIDDREDQLRQLEEDIRKTKDTLMCLADSLSATLKVKIKAHRVHSTKIEKITRFPTHTPSVTQIGLMPSLVPVQKPINQEHPLPAIYATNEELSANQHIDHISWDSPCHVPIFYDSPPFHESPLDAFFFLSVEPERFNRNSFAPKQTRATLFNKSSSSELPFKGYYCSNNAFGWLLEDIHVTWAHLEKKRTRRLYTNPHDDIAYNVLRRRHDFLDDVRM